jgi:hypothetical protein
MLTYADLCSSEVGASADSAGVAAAALTRGTQFTGFTSTKVQVLTPEELL